MDRGRTAFGLFGATLLAVALLWAPAYCEPRERAGVSPVPERVQVAVAREIARFEQPVALAAPPGDRTRLFVVEKTGRVRVVREGRVLAAPFCDLSDVVSGASEQGLLGLAFSPRYAETRTVYLNYTDRAGDSRVVALRARADDPDRADPKSMREILRLEQPYRNHNGGCLAFGPDGYLYIGFGDGGAAGDPHGNGQNRGTWLGAMLRIDVEGAGEGRAYRIPPDNPWPRGEGGARPEVWAIGLRNPWRYAFDRASGDLYVADVGQNRWEEVNVVSPALAAGANFGWRRFEGLHPYGRGRRENSKPLLRRVDPVVEYGHRFGCSITGGVVYRGEALPELAGCYFYADFCSGRIWSFRYVEGEVRDHWAWRGRLGLPRGAGRWSSFGEDAAGEVYLLSLDGPVYRLERRNGR